MPAKTTLAVPQLSCFSREKCACLSCKCVHLQSEADTIVETKCTHSNIESKEWDYWYFWSGQLKIDIRIHY